MLVKNRRIGDLKVRKVWMYADSSIYDEDICIDKYKCQLPVIRFCCIHANGSPILNASPLWFTECLSALELKWSALEYISK